MQNIQYMHTDDLQETLIAFLAILLVVSCGNLTLIVAACVSYHSVRMHTYSDVGKNGNAKNCSSNG